MNAHQEPAYADDSSGHLPHSEAARDAVVLLPLPNSLTEAEQAFVVDWLGTRARVAELSSLRMVKA